jgi:hypothetical protein
MTAGKLTREQVGVAALQTIVKKSVTANFMDAVP